MKSIDDVFKDLYKDDPEGYKKMQEERKKWRIEHENRNRLERKKIAKLYSQPTRDKMHEKIDAMDENELLFYYSHLKTVSEAIKHQYYKLTEENIFSVSKTTLKELLEKHNWEEVRDEILSLFPDQKENMDGYQHVYSELKKLTPKENEENLVIVLDLVEEEYTDDETNEVIKNTYYEVIAKKPNDMTSYAIEFNPWEEWLGFYCNQSNIDENGELFFIAHAMWEMTFNGYTQEDVEQKTQDLRESIEEVEEEIKKDKER